MRPRAKTQKGLLDHRGGTGPANSGDLGVNAMHGGPLVFQLDPGFPQARRFPGAGKWFADGFTVAAGSIVRYNSVSVYQETGELCEIIFS